MSNGFALLGPAGPVIIWVCVILLGSGAVLSLIRAERGPSILDRSVAVDVTVAIVSTAMALLMAVTGRTDLVPVLLVLSLVAFLGSIAVARFASVERDEDGHIVAGPPLTANDRDDDWRPEDNTGASPAGMQVPRLAPDDLPQVEESAPGAIPSAHRSPSARPQSDSKRGRRRERSSPADDAEIPLDPGAPEQANS